MGRIILCTGRYAGTPYHFESICVNVYCVEELCYLLSRNPFMVDTEIMNRALAQWLDTECGLTELSHQLLTLFRRGSQPSVFVNTIFDYVNYCSRQEKEKIEELLQGSAGLSDYQKQKKQADYLMGNGRYQMAITEYERMLMELPENETEIIACVYHNMGVACSNLFQFENAARYLKKAYELGGREESGLQYLLAERMQLTEGEYVSFMADNGQYYELSLKVEKLWKQEKEQFEATRESRMLSALQIYKEEGNTASYYEEIDKIIAGLKEKYRESVER